MEPISIAGLLLRRAVLGTLLAAGRPLTAREVADALAAAGATTASHLTKGPSRVIADLLAHQAKVGKVRKVAPATFAVVPASMSRSTRRRCLRWQLQLADLRELIRQYEEEFSPSNPPNPHLCSGSPRSDAGIASERGEPSHTGDLRNPTVATTILR